MDSICANSLKCDQMGKNNRFWTQRFNPRNAIYYIVAQSKPMGGSVAVSRRNTLKIRAFLSNLIKKISDLFLLLANRLNNIVEVTLDEEAERCPCCGYTPCDCDDH